MGKIRSILTKKLGRELGIIVALAILAAALCVFAMRRWRELETEIVERVHVEQALVDSEERYRTLAEAAQDFIFIANRQGLIQYLNSYAAGKLAIGLMLSWANLFRLYSRRRWPKGRTRS